MAERLLIFDASLHSGDAIQRAVYNLSDRLSCNLVADGSTWRCTVHLDASSDSEVDAVLADFRNEVLDQVLRARIRDETRDVRNLILALAFSNTGLVDAADA